MLKFRIMSLGSLATLVWVALSSTTLFTLQAATTPSVAQAQGIVRDIQVTGNRRVEPETVRSYLQFTVGDAYEPGVVDASLRSLFATGLFSDVQIDSSGGSVLVTVEENPVVNQVVFEGNSEVENSTLQSEVQLKPRSIYTRSRVQADAQRILDVYRRQGLFAASVEPQIIELEQNRVNLVFEISEGIATKVKGINFIGNRAFTDTQLRDIISTTQSGWFDFLKGTAVYDPDRLSLDRELLRQYYLKNGYADARIVSANAELDVDGSGFFINFAIEEGELYTFGDVQIDSSLPDLNASTLYADVLTQQGAIYNGSLIDKSVEKLTLAVAEQGYAFARVRPRAVPDIYQRTIGMNYVIDEGPRVYIERINIYGNARTKDHVIRREFRLAEGDAYNPLLVDRAKKRLKSLGFFKDVQVRRTPGSSQDRVILDVALVEQSTGELSFGAGYSTSEGVIGDISISERNLLGNGQFLRLKLGGSLERLQVDLSFTEPRFLDYNLAAGFDLFHKELDQSDTSGFRSRKTGGTVRLGFPLAESLWGQVRYTISRDDIYDVENDASPAIQDAEGEYWTSSVGGTLKYDQRNHPRNPTRGFYLQTSVDFAGIGGDAQYARLSAEGRAYYPVAEKVTLVGRAVAGHIEGYGDEDIRILDLYFRGGETVRGFDRSGFGPRDTGSANRDALGGKTYWAVTAELRFPIPVIPEDLGISAAVFADAGSLFGASERAEALANNLQDDASIRSSVGASVLWNSPVGPLRLDYAHVLSSEDYDDEQSIRFGASTNF
ncbi:MAG: outer membrane protein assembly factor BamA [Pseudomonadota bacterium]